MVSSRGVRMSNGRQASLALGQIQYWKQSPRLSLRQPHNPLVFGSIRTLHSYWYVWSGLSRQATIFYRVYGRPVYNDLALHQSTTLLEQRGRSYRARALRRLRCTRLVNHVVNPSHLTMWE